MDMLMKFRRRLPEGLVCALYAGGTALGLWGHWVSGPVWQSAAGTAAGFSDVCFVTVAPLVLAALAAYGAPLAGAWGMAALRGFCLGLSLGGAVEAAGAARGLLLLFSALASGGVLVWFLLRRVRLGRERFRPDVLLCLGLDLAIALADRWWVGPYLIG